MKDSQHAHGKNAQLRSTDFRWGRGDGPARIGIWVARTEIGLGKNVEIRAAIQNVSSQPTEVRHECGLVVQHGHEVKEYVGGPRSSEPILLQPGELREVLGWSLNEESGLSVGINRCWVRCRAADEELRSGVVGIEVR